MRAQSAALLMVLALAGFEAGLLAGEAAPAAPPTPGKREGVGRPQTLAPLPFITPKEACGELAAVSVAGGKGSLPLPVKSGSVSLLYARGAVAVDPGDGRANQNYYPVPKTGFSQLVEVPLTYADGATGKAVLGFTQGRKPDELLCRNFAVVAVQIGDCNICLVDENCNGKYNDAGEDAIYLNSGRLAAPLGASVMLGDALYSLQVSESGQKLTATQVPAKLGYAGLNARGGWEQLIGAVVKGSDGGNFVLRADQAVRLPAGSYALVFACLADAGDHRAVIRGGELNLNVAEAVEGRIGVAALDLGAVHMAAPEVSWDPILEKLTINHPKADAVACAGGKITYLFPPPPPLIDFVDVNTTKEFLKYHNLRMPAAPTPLVLGRVEHNINLGLRYRVDLNWFIGLGPTLKSSAEVRIPRRSEALQPPKKK